MRVPSNLHWPEPPSDPEKVIEWARNLNEAMKQHFQYFTEILNGNMTLGDGTSVDNLAGEFQTIADSGLAGSEITIPHTLGQIPAGLLLVVPPANGSVNVGPTSWTTTQVFLKCSSANQSFKIFLLALPSR